MFFPPALEEKRGGERYDISLPSVINLHSRPVRNLSVSDSECFAITVLYNALLFVGERFTVQRACSS